MKEGERLKKDLNFVAGEEFYEAYKNEHWELYRFQDLLAETQKQNYSLSYFDPSTAILPETFNIHNAMPLETFAEEHKFSEVSMSTNRLRFSSIRDRLTN